MSSSFMLSSYAVVNEGCPIKHSVGGSNSAHFVLGHLPEAVELEFDYDSMRVLAKASADALAMMRAKYSEVYGEEPEDHDDEPMPAGEHSA